MGTKNILNGIMGKSVLNADFLREFCKTASNLYRLGWDERNGGNISYLLDEKEVGEYLDLNAVKTNGSANTIYRLPLRSLRARFFW